MSADSNPNNYPGVQIASLVGNVAADPAYPAYDKQGARGRKEIRIGVSQGYKKDGQWVELPTAWYSYSATDEFLQNNPVGKGDKIRIDDAKLETREFERQNGSQGLGLNISFGTLTVLESKNGGSQQAPAAQSDGDYF